MLVARHSPKCAPTGLAKSVVHRPIEEKAWLAFGLLISQQIWENVSREGSAQSAKFLLLPQHRDVSLLEWLFTTAAAAMCTPVGKDANSPPTGMGCTVL